MTTLRVLPLADPPIASYSDLVAVWGWIGRSSQVPLPICIYICIYTCIFQAFNNIFYVLQGAIDELHHCIVEAIDLRAKLCEFMFSHALVSNISSFVLRFI